MGFFDVFIKTWQVRKSIQIQESIESSLESARKHRELSSNLPDIINEIVEVNSSWEAELERRTFCISSYDTQLMPSYLFFNAIVCRG
ncbi:MAG: hypothetical protein RL664_1503 [Bacteroidota bacterium]